MSIGFTFFIQGLKTYSADLGWMNTRCLGFFIGSFSEKNIPFSTARIILLVFSNLLDLIPGHYTAL